ncbi:MAG: hypothetical protein WCO09_05005 [bacterium]
MKTYCSTPHNPVFLALLQVFPIIVPDETWEIVEDKDLAEVIFVIADFQQLADIYTKTGVYAYADTGRNSGKINLPDNVVFIDMLGDFSEKAWGVQCLKRLVEKTRAKKPEVKTPIVIPTDILSTLKCYRVLVIDDKEENLALARHLLLPQHQLVTARGFDQGMKAFETEEFDAVLSDMEMPANKHYPSLSLSSTRLGEDYGYGFFSIFEVTAKGVPIAIVTDGNHHSSWISAGLDRLKEAKVNGQKVLFFNFIGKRWDIALKALMEPEEK